MIYGKTMPDLRFWSLGTSPILAVPIKIPGEGEQLKARLFKGFSTIFPGGVSYLPA